MAEFLLGLFLIYCGATGNAGALLDELSECGGFIPFSAAGGILYFIWVEVPPPERNPVRAIIAAVGAGILITQSSRIIAAAQTGWAAVQAIGSGGGSLNPSGSGSGSGMDNGLIGNPSWSGAASAGGMSAAQINAESGGRQFDSQGNPLTSSAGAVGVAQMLPSTAQMVAQQHGIAWDQNQFENNASYNQNLGDLYMSDLRSQFGGNNAVATAAYNAGPNNPGVQYFYQTGDGSRLPNETQNYLLSQGISF